MLFIAPQTGERELQLLRDRMSESRVRPARAHSVPRPAGLALSRFISPHNVLLLYDTQHQHYSTVCAPGARTAVTALHVEGRRIKDSGGGLP